MPITARLLEKANSAPNSGQGSNSAPDASRSFMNGYTVNGNTINWTTSSTAQDIKTHYDYYLNNVSNAVVNNDRYYYNSNVGFDINTRLNRNIGSIYTYPTDPTSGFWISNNNIITVSSSIITAITPLNSLSSSSNININICAPSGSPSGNIIIYAYAVTGSTPITVNTNVTIPFYWSGSTNTLSGSLVIPSGSTCVSSSFSITSQSLVNFTYTGSVSPLVSGSYIYISGLITSGSCPSCP